MRLLMVSLLNAAAFKCWKMYLQNSNSWDSTELKQLKSHIKSAHIKIKGFF